MGVENTAKIAGYQRFDPQAGGVRDGEKAAASRRTPNWPLHL
jgi:hypothetical protein